MAIATTAGVLGVVALNQPRAPGEIARDAPAPAFAGVTLDGEPLSLAGLRGSPVIVNFWGPSCVPCRDEFPLFKSKLAEHADDGLVIVGVLMHDPPEPARTFIAEHGASWPTVLDPDGAIRSAYRTLARPTSFFIDREGILRSVQIGEVRAADFDRQYAQIAS